MMESKRYTQELKLELPKGSFSEIYDINGKVKQPNYSLSSTSNSKAIRIYTVTKWGHLKRQFKFSDYKENIFHRATIDHFQAKIVSARDETILKADIPNLVIQKELNIQELVNPNIFSSITLKIDTKLFLVNYSLTIVFKNNLIVEYLWKPTDLLSYGWVLNRVDGEKSKVLQYKVSVAKPNTLLLFEEIDNYLLEVLILTLSFIICYQEQKRNPITSNELWNLN